MRFIQIGVPATQHATSYVCRATDTALPYQSVWWLSQTPPLPGSIRLIPDLSMHLVFDVSGVLEVEPFLIYTGERFHNLMLPAGVQLLGMQFAVWEALQLREAENAQPATYSVSFDEDWARLLYFSLLDARNTGANDEQALQVLAQFKRRIDRSLRKDWSAHFVQMTAQRDSQPSLAYSERHQRRLYRELTGMPPTRFRSILRFQQTLQRVRAEGRLSWDGYYDQAHFIREFRSFTAMTPARYLTEYVV